MELQINLSNNRAVLLTRKAVLYWGEDCVGAPTFKGSLDDLGARYPEILQELIDLGAVKAL